MRCTVGTYNSQSAVRHVWLTLISIIEFETCAENVPEKKRGPEDMKKKVYML